MLKIRPRVNVKVKVTWSERFMLHIGLSLSSSLTHLRCFYRSSLPIKSYCRKTANDLLWPEMTSGTWGGVNGHNLSIQEVNFTCKTTECLECFPSKKSHFLVLTSCGERAQKLPDPMSPIYKFWATHFILRRKSFGTIIFLSSRRTET